MLTHYQNSEHENKLTLSMNYNSLLESFLLVKDDDVN